MGKARGWTAAGFRATKCWDPVGPRTGFQFMANKQFIMEKDWENQCALISHNMLSKPIHSILYEEKKPLNTFF